MNRRLAAFAIATAFLMHATGITLAVHLLECGDDHDAQQCSACHMLVGNSSILPAQLELTDFDVSFVRAATWPGDGPCLNRFDARPESPRAPPGLTIFRPQ